MLCAALSKDAVGFDTMITNSVDCRKFLDSQKILLLLIQLP